MANQQRQDDLPPDAYAAALACLPAVGPNWLFNTLGEYDPRRAWYKVVDGSLRLSPAGSRSAPSQLARAEEWASWAPRFNVARHWESCTAKGIGVTWHRGPGYPERLGHGPLPVGALSSPVMRRHWVPDRA